MKKEGVNPKATAVAERFGAALCQAMTERKMSAKRLAAELGAGESSVSGWRTGRRLVPLWRIPELEDVLELHRGYLLHRAGLVDDQGLATVEITTAGQHRVVVNGTEVPMGRRAPMTLVGSTSRPTSVPPSRKRGGVA